MKTSSLRKLILVPTMLALIILLGAFAISTYWNQKRDIRDEVETKLESVEKLFKALLDVNASMMGAALKVIMRDSELKAAFREKDRESLYNQSSPLFEQLRSGHGITHFYFTDPSRVNLLRVHQQDRSGDIIDRFTTLEAEKTGRLSYGIEPGPLGTFTLRVVAPWHDGERLIGYVELGKEIEQIIDELREVLGVELYVFINKEFLDRQDWESSMNKLGRDPDWNRLPSQVLTAGTLKIIPEELTRFLSKKHHPHEMSDIEISLDGRIYVSKYLDLKDAAARSVGDLVVLSDVTRKVADFRKSVFLISVFCLAIGGALFTFFYIFLGRVEKQLSETQRRVLELERDRSKFILDNLPEHISLIDQNGCFAQWSPYSEKMFGYTSDEAMGRLRPEDVMQHPENAINMASTVKEKGFAEQEIRGLRKDGTLPWLEFRMVEMHERDGTTSVLAIAEDITSRKQAEVALQESEERYRALFERSLEVVYLCDFEGNFIDANDAALELLGYTKDEIKSLNFGSLLEKDQIPLAFDTAEEILKTGSQKEVVEYKLRRNDGEYVYVESMGAMINRDGKPFAIQGIARDITERKRLEDERLKLETQLQQAQKMEAIGTLAGGIAHDFNNILSAVMGYAQLAQMKLDPDSEPYADLKEVLQATNRARLLIRQILAIGRDQEQERQSMQLKYTVKEALKLLRSTLPSTIEIRETYDQDVGVIDADPTQMHQVIMNLCTNAGHVMQEEGGILEVRLRNAEFGLGNAEQNVPPGHYLELTVSDTGCGMTPEVMEKVFDPYFTTKVKGEGTGIGLSVVHGIVSQNGGTITVESKPGKGSTFHVYLPLIQGEEEQPEVQEETRLPKGNERILFIDDEAVLANMGKQMLNGLGYDVTSMTSSIEALALFKEDPKQFDLVITDTTMPHMTGDILAQELMRIRPDIPVVISTGHSKRISPEKAEEMGLKGFLMKPLAIRDLANLVRKVLDEK
ncbi:MAG: hypothetical protein QG552_438 [Thermodesulfobacteriota bacterium]|nr:hypothetical protein [Thermodesulfobacteriota bacterium]